MVTVPMGVGSPRSSCHHEYASLPDVVETDPADGFPSVLPSIALAALDEYGSRVDDCVGVPSAARFATPGVFVDAGSGDGLGTARHNWLVPPLHPCMPMVVFSES